MGQVPNTTNYPLKVPNTTKYPQASSSPSKQGRLRHDIPCTWKSDFIYLYSLLMRSTYINVDEREEAPEVRRELGPLRIR